MNENTEINSDLESAFKSEKLQDLAIDMVDMGLDSLIKNDVIKEIPYLRAFSAGLSIYGSIKDKHTLKKILRFLFQIKQLSDEEKDNFLFKLYDDRKYKNEVFEKLVILLDRLDDSEKATIIGNLFVAAVKHVIPLRDFFKLAFIVDSTFIDDLKAFYCKHGWYFYKSNDWCYKSYKSYYDERNLNTLFASYGIIQQKLEVPFINEAKYKRSNDLTDLEYRIVYAYDQHRGLGKLFVENGFGNIQFPPLKPQPKPSNFFKFNK